MPQREISNYANGYFSLYRNFGEPWACCDCDCPEKLEQRLASQGEPFLESLRSSQLRTVSTKPQAPEKFQLQPPKDVGSDWSEFEDWSFFLCFGCWGFGA